MEQEQKRMHLEAQLVVTETARKAAEAELVKLRTRINFFAQEVAQ